MKLLCVCGEWHGIAPAGMVLIIQAFQDGELLTMTELGVTTTCVLDAFTEENATAILKRYPRRKLLD